MTEFDALVGDTITCAMVFDSSSLNWQEWDRPWFTSVAADWTRFARTPGNQLIITLNLFPANVADTDWRAIGADGGYTSYARILARNLIRAGMGDAIIRLANEANGTWFSDNIGDTATQYAQWKSFWRATVIAMRSVPGAHFSFNWCIAAGYRPIPFADYYPGDDVVNSIGVDVYDVRISPVVRAPGTTAAAATTVNRWQYFYDEPGGIRSIVAFARANHKPLAIPEWGLDPSAIGGGGDDIAFMKGIAALVRTAPVAFQAYFFRGDPGTALSDSPNSLRIYKALLHDDDPAGEEPLISLAHHFQPLQRSFPTSPGEPNAGG